MGQTPSCMPTADPMRKRFKTGSPASDGPMAQSMTRFNTSSHNTSPTLQRTSPSSFTFSPTSPPSPLSLTRKRLTVDPDLATDTPTGFSPSSTGLSTSASSSSVRSLFTRLSTKRGDTRQWLAETPKGADALRFRHFCPICYRHFAAILVTSCCAHNICNECATGYLQAKLPNYLPLAFLPSHAMPCPCPTCNQHNGVRFIRVTNTREARSYVESPRTAALMRQHEREAEAEVDGHRQVEGVEQLQHESEGVQQLQGVMA